ncbi:phosphotransferase [Alphaproteobacteria bacterium]|nr:phosphotransferase [Alphaproteobacteria bacterium]
MDKTLVTFPSHHKGIFSRSYLGKINKKQAFFKIYEQNMLKNFPLDINKKYQSIYKIASNLQIIPKLLYIDENLIIQEYITNDNFDIKEFFKVKNLAIFKKTIKKFNTINCIGTPNLYSQIINYKKTLKKNEFFKEILNNSENIKNYINIYNQEYLCHGDLHFNNIIKKKNKFFLIDLDYICMSSRGYDIAMLAYQEELSKNKIKELSLNLKIDIQEIYHYEPICLLLDYLWQQNQLELKIIKKNYIDKRIIKNFLKSIS